MRLQTSVDTFSKHLYDVIIDDANNVTSIRKTLNADVIASTSDVRLDCDRSKFFWLRWEEGVGVELGSGTKVGVNSLLSAADSEAFPVHFVMLAASQFYQPVTFVISKDFGKTVIRLKFF